jgi:hypothetical protein
MKRRKDSKMLIPATDPLYVSDMYVWEWTHPAEEPASKNAA